MAANRRLLLPDNFDKDSGLQLPELKPEGIVRIVGATLVGGPAAGCLEFGLQVASSPGVALTAFTLNNLVSTGNNLFQLLKNLTDFVGDKDTTALKGIATALGNPGLLSTIETTTVANALAGLNRGLTKPANNQVIPHVEAQPFIDAYLEKKTLRTVAISITQHPADGWSLETEGHATIAWKLGFLVWKRGANFVGERVYIYTLKFLAIAPHSEIDGHDLVFYKGVNGTVTTGEIPVPW